MTQSDLEFLRSRHGLALGEIESLKEEVRRLKGIISCGEEQIGELQEKNEALLQQFTCARSMVQAMQGENQRLIAAMKEFIAKNEGIVP